MELSIETLDLLTAMCQVCINTYEGKHGKVVPVLSNIEHIDTGKVQVDIGEYKDYIVVAFQGSRGKQDWKDNLKFFMIFVGYYLTKKIWLHKGFNSQFLEANPSIRRWIVERIKSTTHKKIIFTGHSLGGIIATFCAAFMFDVFDMQFLSKECYTFGSPRGGNSVFVSLFNSRVAKSIRVILKGDPVGRVPFALPTLKHIANWIRPLWMNCRHVPNKLKLIYKGKVSTAEKLLSILLWIPRLIIGNPKMHEPERYLEELERLRQKMVNDRIEKLREEVINGRT